MLRLLYAPSTLLRALLLLAVILTGSGCWVLRDVGIDLPGERELKLKGLQELAVRLNVDSYGRPILGIRLPPSGVPCPRMSDSVKVTIAGEVLRRRSAGGPFHRNGDFTPSGCNDHAEWWAPTDIPPDAELVLSDGERVIKASGPHLLMLRKVTAPAQWKLGTTAEVALEPASDRVLRANVGFSSSNRTDPPIKIPKDSLQYEGNKIRFPVPAVDPGRHSYAVQIFELEGPVARCEGVPRCLYADAKIEYLSVDLVR
jgi:hypothetical protein